jgi:hypothetical protein
LATYNLHLESKENDALRVSQLNEVMADIRSSNGDRSTLVAGDLNLNAGEGKAAAAFLKAGFRGAVGLPNIRTRGPRGGYLIKVVRLTGFSYRVLCIGVPAKCTPMSAYRITFRFHLYFL